MRALAVPLGQLVKLASCRAESNDRQRGLYAPPPFLPPSVLPPLLLYSSSRHSCVISSIVSLKGRINRSSYGANVRLMRELI